MTNAELQTRDYGHTVSCAKCRTSVNGLHHADPSGALAAMGWRAIGDGKWVCSLGCFKWLELIASSTEPALTPVHSVSDRAYQKRRPKV
jgi:hypothetical protein